MKRRLAGFTAALLFALGAAAEAGEGGGGGGPGKGGPHQPPPAKKEQHPPPKKEQPPPATFGDFPAELCNFNGKVRGVVAGKEGGKRLLLKVLEVMPAPNNQAKNPAGFVGRTITVEPRVGRNMEGMPQPNPAQYEFVRAIPEGSEVTVDVQNARNDRFRFNRVSHDEVAAARKAAEEAGDPAYLPEGVRRFSGVVSGVVAAKPEGSIRLLLEVTEVGDLAPNNQAKDPEALKGRKIEVGPTHTQNKQGQWIPNRPQAHFIEFLEEGGEVALQVRNTHGGFFAIQELDAEQQAWVKTKRAERKSGAAEGGAEGAEGAGEEEEAAEPGRVAEGDGSTPEEQKAEAALGGAPLKTLEGEHNWEEVFGGE